MTGVIIASNAYVLINRCRFADNIVIWLGIIDALNVHLTDTSLHNNTIHSMSGITFGNATIQSCTFTCNEVEIGHRLVVYQSGRPYSTLKVIQSNFTHNKGDVIWVQTRIDIQCVPNRARPPARDG